MKKLLYLLLLLPLSFLASCSNDDELPSVDVSVTMSNAVRYDGKIYVVEGQPLSVDSIGVKSLNGKATGITGVNYALDYVGIGYNVVSPFGAKIPAAYLPTGNHLLTLSFDVLQVDKTIAFTRVSTLVKVVPESELPAGTTPGVITLNYTLNPKE